ncbi:MAG: Hsp20/alpha crystallin family protein [Anaerolineaceae bacterium]|nr:Hsp20/alpha crystallin family protein [Anaerolineaceae bacterium]
MGYYISNSVDRRTHRGTGWHRFYNEFVGSDGKVFFPIDVKEEENSYVILASLPGVESDHMDIQIEKDIVTIQGEVSKKVEENDRFVHQERASGKFYRAVQMPNVLDASKAEAELKDGVLTLRIPKAEEALSKKIEIKSK